MRSRGAFSWSADSKVMTFNPDSDLAEGSTFDAKVGTGAKDAAGNGLETEKGWSFDSAPSAPTAPSVSSVSPAMGRRGEPGRECRGVVFGGDG